MNRYPMWKYAIIIFAVIAGLLYSSPTLLSNVFGTAPVVRVSMPNAEQLEEGLEGRIKNSLSQAGIKPLLVSTGRYNVTVRLGSDADQQKAQHALSESLRTFGREDDFSVSLNKDPLTPEWLKAIGAKPMSLGLDLRGGVHFLLQIDMASAINDRLDSMVRGIRTDLDKEKVVASVSRKGQTLEVSFANEEARAAGSKKIRAVYGFDVDVVSQEKDGKPILAVSLSSATAQRIQELALQQNMTTLHNRINALGVAEPVIQQQGLDRIVVQLPGVEDTSTAKSLIGRTATLQIRLVNDSAEAQAVLRGQGGLVPFGSELFYDAEGLPLILHNDVYLTGENLTDAQPGRSQTGIPAVFLTLDSAGRDIFYDITLKNTNKRLAIVLFEEGKGRVVTAPNINEPIAGGRVQISGSMSSNEASSISLLLRSGSLAAPMEIIEERTIGPSLGEDNIERGIKSVVYGFAAVALFMCIYYALFGGFSTIAMFINLLLLVSVISLLQATLTLPGIAAMALALGIAIDSNVLINERIREELRAGATPQMAITAGYEHAWRTILDSNVTSMIAGIALLTCDAGPIRGFAIVHILGILTSLFSSVFVSRGIVNLWYGRRRNLEKLSIGQVWKPEEN